MGGTDRLLDIEAAAEFLGISVSTLYHWVSDGKIDFVKLNGRLVRFRQSDLDAYIERHVVKAKRKIA